MQTEAPEVAPRWFRALDGPKRDATPFKFVPQTVASTVSASAATSSAATSAAAASASVAASNAATITAGLLNIQSTSRPPTQWEPLSARDSAAVEAIYSRLPRLSQTPQRSVSPSRVPSSSVSSATIAAIGIGGSISGPASHGLSASIPSIPSLTIPERLPSRPENRIIGGEDYLYEIDVENKEIYPLYWEGPTHHIRRATWFAQTGVGSTFQPCDENLARQLEDGYRKFAPWIPGRASETAPAALTSISSSDDAAAPVIKPEAKWALFGPYMNQYAVYNSATTAWLQSDMLSSKLTRAVMYSSGIRLVRGYDEVCKLNTKARNPVKPPRSDEKSSDGATTTTEDRTEVEQQPLLPAAPPPKSSSTATPAPSSVNTGTMAPEEELEQDRQIDHLVFVIHGIGQKLSERIDAVNFPQDCNVLRNAIKDAARQMHDRNATIKSPEITRIPKGGGIQVLPIQWRQKVEFKLGKPRAKMDEKDDGIDDDVTLEDITLEGIPGIRMLVSDVIMDVLLYLTPKYRQEMIRHVSVELNRVYKLYLERNPGFKGKVSIYGHSLGSVLAYDILSHQSIARNKPSTGNRSPPRMPEIDISDVFAMTMNQGRVSGLIERFDDMKYVPLDFRVNALFAVGSPVALFLLLRGNQIRPYLGEPSPIDSRFSRPEIQALYNIFHPFDPVAHRFEPLVHKSFSSLRPVQVPYTKGGLTKTIAGIQDLGTDIVERGWSIFETMRSGLFSGFSTTAEIVNQAGRAIGLASSGVPQESIQAQQGLGVAGQSSHLSEAQSTNQSTENVFDSKRNSTTRKVERLASASDAGSDATMAVTTAAATAVVAAAVAGAASNTATTSQGGKPNEEYDRATAAVKAAAKVVAEQNTDIKLLNPNGRIDYALTEGVLENPYLSSLGVHMSYWGDSDCAAFILKELNLVQLLPGITRKVSSLSAHSDQTAATPTLPPPSQPKASTTATGTI